MRLLVGHDGPNVRRGSQIFDRGDRFGHVELIESGDGQLGWVENAGGTAHRVQGIGSLVGPFVAGHPLRARQRAIA